VTKIPQKAERNFFWKKKQLSLQETRQWFDIRKDNKLKDFFINGNIGI